MEEVPLLKQLRAKYANKVTLVGIAVDEDMAKVDQKVKEKGMNWTILADPKGYEGAILAAYRVQGTPDIFVIDAGGRIVKRLDSAGQIDAIVQPLLE